MNNKPFLSYPLYQFSEEQVDTLNKILNKQKEPDIAIKGRMLEFRKIKENFQPKHYETANPGIIGIGSIISYELNEKLWENVVIDNTSICIDGKTVAISTATPLVKALLGKKAGDIATYTAGGVREVKITSVSEYSAKRILELITTAKSVGTHTPAEPIKKEKEVLA